MSYKETVGTITNSNSGVVKCKSTNETFNVNETETTQSLSQTSACTCSMTSSSTFSSNNTLDLKLVFTEDILLGKSETNRSSDVKESGMVCALNGENGCAGTLESFKLNVDRASKLDLEDLAAAKITASQCPQAELPKDPRVLLLVTKDLKADATKSTAIGDELRTQTNCTPSPMSGQQDAPLNTDAFATEQGSNNLESQLTEVDVCTESIDEDVHKFVDYQEEDFKTDSEFEDSSPSKEMGSICMKSKRKREEQKSPVLLKKQKSQGSSQQADKEKDGNSEGKYPEFLKNLHPRLASFRRQWSDKDTLEYRRGYPGKKDVKNQKENLLFYTGKIPSQPNGAFIDEIHDDWYYDLDRLERHHGYIQWLFPIRESGMNWHAQELQQHEAEAIKADKKAMDRFIKSYRMMLHFYGIKLVNIQTGGVQREKNWQARFQHLNFSMHNYLRITRILKCLGEMGLEHYKVPLLKFLLREAIQTKTLSRTLESCYCYWIGTIKDDSVRADLKEYANQLCWDVETSPVGSNGRSNSSERLRKSSERDGKSHPVQHRNEEVETRAVVDTKAFGEGVKVIEPEEKSANSAGDRKVSSVASKYFCQKETSTVRRVGKDRSCPKNENLAGEKVPEMEYKEENEYEGIRGHGDKNKTKQRDTDILSSPRKENKIKQKMINDYFH